MKKIDVVKYRFFAFAFSILIIALGPIFYFVHGGFNKGIDFGSGYSLNVGIVPVGMYVTGSEGTSLSYDDGMLLVRFGTDEAEIDLDGISISDLEAFLNENGVGTEVVDYDLLPANIKCGLNFPMRLGAEGKALNFATESVDVTIQDVRDALSSLDGVNVQTVGARSDGVFQIRFPLFEGMSDDEALSLVLSTLDDAFGKDTLVMLQSDYVGPRFSSELITSSIKAIAIAIVLILVYISFRFRPSYAISSVLALVHDVLSMLSLILVLDFEVSSTTIAAILTIIGYSLNNTIVIFDRVREEMGKDYSRPVDDVIGVAVAKSLTRTMITSLTTLFAIVPLAIFSTGGIKLFAINLTWGLLIGTYSSNMIAPALLHYFHKIFPINVEKKKVERDYSLVDD